MVKTQNINHPYTLSGLKTGFHDGATEGQEDSERLFI